MPDKSCPGNHFPNTGILGRVPKRLDDRFLWTKTMAPSGLRGKYSINHRTLFIDATFGSLEISAFPFRGLSESKKPRFFPVSRNDFFFFEPGNNRLDRFDQIFFRDKIQGNKIFPANLDGHRATGSYTGLAAIRGVFFPRLRIFFIDFQCFSQTSFLFDGPKMGLLKIHFHCAAFLARTYRKALSSRQISGLPFYAGSIQSEDLVWEKVFPCWYE